MSDKKIRPKTLENRKRILASASRLFKTLGVHNTSLADIAKDLKISKGTLYYYYSSKADLMFDITERHMNLIGDQILRYIKKNKDTQTPAEVLQVILRLIIKGKSRGQNHLYLIQQALENTEDLADRFRGQYRKWLELIQTGLDELLGRQDDNKLLSTMLLATIDGCLLQSLVGVVDIPLPQIAAFLTKSE